MENKDLSMEISRIEREHADKVRNMIDEKFKALRGESVEVVEEPKRLTYDEAKAQGNVKEMIKIKSGYYQRLDRERELKDLLENIDIVSVSNELNEIDEKIADQKKLIERTIEKARESAEAEYSRRMKNYRAYGGTRGGHQEMLIQTDYYKSIKSIDDMNSIKTLRNELAKMQDRKAMLNYSKNKFIEDNASLIAEEQKRKKLEQIRLAGLV